MPNPGYIRSTDGNNADDGSTWALAKATFVGAVAIDVAGDTWWVSDNHAESTAGAISIGFVSASATPTRILCGDDAAEPPTALATTATITTTGNNAITISGANALSYWYGLTFIAGSGASGTASILLSNSLVFEQCNFRLASTGTGSLLNLQNNDQQSIFLNCGFRFGSASHGIRTAAGGTARISGGSLLSGGTSPTTLLVGSPAGGSMIIEGFDLSNASSTINLASVTSGNVSCIFRDCKLPASWSGVLHSGTPGHGSVYEMFNCDSGDTHYRYRRAAAFGTIKEETTLVRTGGSAVESTTYSLKMVTNADAEHPINTLATPEMADWNATTGSSITVTVEFLHDSATALKDNEIWLEVMYLGTSGVPLGSFINDGISVVATAANQASSSETWTTTGMTNPNTQKMSVTFTPQEAGFIHATVKMAKASYTVYVDAMFTVT